MFQEAVNLLRDKHDLFKSLIFKLSWDRSKVALTGGLDIRHGFSGISTEYPRVFNKISLLSLFGTHRSPNPDLCKSLVVVQLTVP